MTRLRTLLVVIPVCLTPPMEAAATSEPDTRAEAGARASAISGRVQNVASGQYLINARVSVKGTDLTAFTDESGVYRLTNVPPGPVVLEVFYSGLDPRQIPLDVGPGAAMERDIELTNRVRYGDETVRLDPFTVASARLTEGEELATNEQRFAGNIKNVVTTDAFGDVTGGNPAEFLQFLPGISIEDEGPQANRVGVRGLPSDFTNISVDGVELANMPTQAAIASRAFEFKQVSTNNVSRIEVTKVPTPASPADSLAGGVNMVSKSAFERSRAQLNYRLFLSYNSEMDLALRKTPSSFAQREYRVKPGVDFDYTLPINKRFGIVLTGASTATSSEHNISNKGYNTAGTNTDASPEKPFLASFAKTEGSKYLYRKSASIRADWQATPHSVLSFTGQASDYLDQNGNINLNFNVGTNANPTPATGVRMTYADDFTHGATGRGTITQGGTMHHVYGSMVAGGTRYRFDDGNWQVNGSLNASRSRAWRRYTEEGHFRSLGTRFSQPLRLDFDAVNANRPGSMRGFDNTDLPVDIFDIRNYQVTGASAQPRMDARTDFVTTDASVRRHVNVLSLPVALQVGGRYRTRTVDSRRQSYDYTYQGPGGDNSAARYEAEPFTNHNGYGRLPFASPVLAYRAWQEDPGLFYQTRAQLVASEQYRIINSEEIEETIDAAYLQADFRLLNNRLRVLTGVRYERTLHAGVGPVYDPNAVYLRTATGAFAHNAAGQRIRKPEAGAAGSLEELYLMRQERAARNHRTYDGSYPSLHLTYSATENFLVRAAYARTYGRPNFNSIVPNTTINELDLDEATDPDAIRGNITIRNPALRPWTADNYDVSVEYYTEQGGMLSAGAFRKDIRNFFGTEVVLATPELLQQLGLDAQYVGWNVRTSFNAGDASVTGLELSVRHSLQPLGPWGRHFTVFANLTKLELDGDQDADFSEFIPEVVNWGVNFSRKPVSILARWNYRGKQRLAAAGGMGPGGYNYADYRLGMDLNFTFQPGRRVAYFVNVRNVLNQNRVQLAYAPMTPAYAKTSLSTVYGAQIDFGIKGTF